MNHDNVIRIILPFHEMVSEHSPTENLLGIVGTTTKELVELFLTEWVNFKNGRYHFQYGPRPSEERDFKSPIEAFNHYRESYRMNAYVLVMDLIFGAVERRIENNECGIISEADRRDVEKVMMSIWNSVSNYILDVLLDFGSRAETLEHLKFESWVGDDVMVSIPWRYQPYYRRMSNGIEFE